MTDTDAIDAALLRRAARWPECLDWRDLDVERLQSLACDEGPDFAAALVFDRLRRSGEHGAFIARVDAWPTEPGEPLPATVAILPGAFYGEAPYTGADGRTVREAVNRWGCRHEVIATGEFAPLHENARALLDWLRRHDEAGPIVLVSLSKAGAEVKLALDDPDAEEAFRYVVAWIDLTGMSRGTALVNWVLAQPWRRWPLWAVLRMKGHPFSVVESLARMDVGPLSTRIRVPATMRVIHVFGIPCRRHLSRRFARWSRRIAPLGPSDGAILLGDAVGLPGHIYPVWGADHYLRPAGRNMQNLVTQLLHELAPDLRAHETTRHRDEVAAVPPRG